MTTIEEHNKIIKEFLEDINEKIKANLLAERQKIIGFAASEAAANIFAVLLHEKNIIEPGFNVNHRYFSSEKIAKNKFNFNLPDKEKILKLLVNQEDYRNKLCYGREKTADLVNSAIKNLFELKEIIDKLLEENKNG